MSLRSRAFASHIGVRPHYPESWVGLPALGQSPETVSTEQNKSLEWHAETASTKNVNEIEVVFSLQAYDSADETDYWPLNVTHPEEWRCPARHCGAGRDSSPSANARVEGPSVCAEVGCALRLVYARVHEGQSVAPMHYASATSGDLATEKQNVKADVGKLQTSVHLVAPSGLHKFQGSYGAAATPRNVGEQAARLTRPTVAQKYGSPRAATKERRDEGTKWDEGKRIEDDARGFLTRSTSSAAPDGVKYSGVIAHSAAATSETSVSCSSASTVKCTVFWGWNSRAISYTMDGGSTVSVSRPGGECSVRGSGSERSGARLCVMVAEEYQQISDGFGFVVST
ncbi:hypothetical protein B0H19DRAFT_1079543 [Mycena capillaripes]|nr:hypothetical protein B0H19DRAFT_1079543 [Mycena capillaripes]